MTDQQSTYKQLTAQLWSEYKIETFSYASWSHPLFTNADGQDFSFDADSLEDIKSIEHCTTGKARYLCLAIHYLGMAIDG